MEQETIRAIRDAELAAEQAGQDAARQRDELLAKARADAAETVSRAVAGAKAKAGAALSEAKEQGGQMQREALESVRKEIASQRASADAKGAEVRRLILSELV